jgi:tetratricopeptide (TPR) repeat protein
LGEIALAESRTAEAVEQLSQAVMLDPRDLKARTVLALAERLAGKLDAAQVHIDAVVQELPIDYLALHEQYEIRKALGQEAKAKAASDDLWRLLSREPDSILEVTFDYMAAGRSREARQILEEAIRRGQDRTTGQTTKGVYPMLFYALGYLYQQDGDRVRAIEQYALGAKGDTAYVFPHRVEEIKILYAAREANRTDARAAYYLGNVLASKDRDEEALRAWSSSFGGYPENVIAHRNFARGLWVVSGKKEEAARQYEFAVREAPNDFRLYVEFDKLLAEMGATDRRLRLLENAPAVVKAQSAVVQSLAAAYIEAGRFADAAALLEKTSFTSGEGEDAALALYRRAHLGLARNYQRSGDHLKAAMEFAATTEFPRNLGVGRPAMQSQAREYVAAAREYEAAGRTDEAERWWQRAATEELNPPTQPEEPWSEHYFYKAVALEHVGKKDQARALYERLARLNDEQKMIEAEPWPPSGAIRYVLAGAALKALGRKDEARTALERALKLDPQNELARTQLAELNGATVRAQNF